MFQIPYAWKIQAPTCCKFQSSEKSMQMPGQTTSATKREKIEKKKRKKNGKKHPQKIAALKAQQILFHELDANMCCNFLRHARTHRIYSSCSPAPPFRDPTDLPIIKIYCSLFPSYCKSCSKLIPKCSKPQTNRMQKKKRKTTQIIRKSVQQPT